MRHKITVLISLLVFVMASTAQASEADPKASPLASPIQETPAVKVLRPQTVKQIRVIISPSWWVWYSEGKR